MVYLDNAATSYPKPERVLSDMTDCMREFCANPGRGGHYMAIRSGRVVHDVRERVSAFFNLGNPLQLCFTKNATEGLNIAVKGIVKPGGHVIATSMEHNSVYRPLKTLERDEGTELTFVRGGRFGETDPQDFERSIRQNTCLVVCTLSSNVNGIIMPVGEIGKICREHGIPFLVDASQGAGSIRIDVQEMNIDMLAFPGHEGLMGPQGTGGLYVSEELKIKPLMQGGTGSNSEIPFQPDIMPDLLESGTLNTPGIVGLGSGVGFIGCLGTENVGVHKHMLVSRLHDGLGRIKGIQLYSKAGPGENSGIAALTVKDMDSSEVSEKLDKTFNIATRAGLHCAPLAHGTLGTLKTGVVRLSVGCFNTPDEMDYAVAALERIAAGRVHARSGRMHA